MQTADDTLERKLAWLLAQTYRGRARNLVLVEPQGKIKDTAKAKPLRLGIRSPENEMPEAS